MTGAIAFALLLGRHAAHQVNAGQLVSQMIAYYHDAKSLIGTIRMTQSAGGKQAIIQTDLQFQYPAKLYILQTLQASYGSSQWLVTSDGDRFSYVPPVVPLDAAAGKRLIETCHPVGKRLSVRDVYQAIVMSLGDRSTPLDIIIGRHEDLAYRNYQWATLDVLTQSQIGDTPVTVVGGNYREYGKAPVSGTYEFSIDDQHRLLRYAQRETVGTRVNGQPMVQKVETVWDVDVEKNGAVKSDLFKVVK